MTKIGLTNGENSSIKGGPLVFMTRLMRELKNRELYDEENYSKWLNLSFTKVPDHVMNKKVEIIVRFDGIWNDSIIPNVSFSPSLKYKLDLLFFKMKNRIILENYKKSNKVIYQSEFSKYTIEKLLFDRYKIEPNTKESTIIYNGIDLTKFYPFDKKKSSNFPNILISHRLVPFKRAHQSIEIIKLLKDIYPNLKVHVVGGGVKNPYHPLRDSRKDFMKRVVDAGLEEYYIFHGHIQPDNLPEFYSQCDFMLNLSYADPCPNVVVEAMACGLPVIAPNSGGIPELVRVKELLVQEEIEMSNYQPRFIYRDLPSINPNIYISTINNVIENLDCFSKLMREIAVSNYDIEKITNQYIDFINK